MCECHVGGARCGCAVSVQWVCNGCAVGVWGAECVQSVVGVCLCHVCHVCHVHRGCAMGVGCVVGVQWVCKGCAIGMQCVFGVCLCVSHVSRVSWVCNGCAMGVRGAE